MRFIERYFSRLSRIVGIIICAAVAIQGWTGITEGEITYPTWQSQPLVPAFALMLGVLGLALYLFAPKRWLDRLEGRSRERPNRLRRRAGEQNREA